MHDRPVVRDVVGARQRGFALPVVVVSSMVMITMLLLSLQISVASSNALRSQYYNQLAREASESGMVMAQDCLQRNGFVATWSVSKPLTQSTDCEGNIISGQPQSLSDNGLVRVTFRVDYPGPGVQDKYLAVSHGEVSLLKQSTSTPWKSYTYAGAGIIGGTGGLANLAFGYHKQDGAFYGVIHPDGRLLTAGLNNFGQLGRSSAMGLAPSPYGLPAGEKAIGVFTNFLSLGRSIFVATESGKLYGAGLNNYGQLGAGFTSATRESPVVYQLPTGVRPTSVAMLIDATFVIGDNHSIYTAGRCTSGILGIGSCSGNTTTPVRVALPAVDLSNPNTIPVSEPGGTQPGNIVADDTEVFVLMRGGAVYGWGYGDNGQFGRGSYSTASSPIKIGTFGDSGKTKAKQLAYDGSTIYILDDLGDVYVTGKNDQGQLGGAAAPILLDGSSSGCLDVTGGSSAIGTGTRSWSCNKSIAQQFEWHPDRTLRVYPGGVTRCIAAKDGGTSSGTDIVTASCDPSSPAQQWVHDRDQNHRIFNPVSGRCIVYRTEKGKNELGTCDSGTDQKWKLADDITTISKMPLPDGRKAKKVVSDQWSVLILLDDGTVYGSGDNRVGQLGTGSDTRTQIPELTRFLIPGTYASNKVVDVYTTYHNSLGNTFVVLDNGRIIGSGSNDSGQLGIGTTAAKVYTPAAMSLDSSVGARYVMSGLGTTVLLTTNGRIYSVGNNSHGQLGDGTTVTRKTPVPNAYIPVGMPITLF